MENSALDEKALVDGSFEHRKTTDLEKQISHTDQEKGAVNPDFSAGMVVAFCEFDIDNRQTFFSKSLLDMLGYSLDSIADIYTLLEHLVHPDDKKTVKKAWKESLSGKEKMISRQFRFQRADKSFFWVSASFINLCESGKCNKIVLSVINIDALKLENEALKEAEVQYYNLFEKNLFGIIRANITTDTILQYNQKASELIELYPGISFQELAELLFQDDKEDLLSELSDNGRLPTREIKVTLNDNQVKWLQVTVEGVNEEIVELFIHDITDTKNSIIELQKINFELDNFVYHSSHDLKSPLKSILGLINILKMEKNHIAQQECIDMIEGSIIRLDKLVNDLLSLSRNNRVNDNHMPVNLMVELNNTITNFYHTADTKKLEIIPLVFQPVPFITDLSRIRIILNNLISNAFKYRSYQKERSFVKIEIHVTKEKAKIVVEDNGIGIAQVKLSKVFDMFYRASENSEGSGLGLYIVKNVLDKINATIAIQSEEGKGTTFTVEIPNHLEEAAMEL